MLPLLLLLPAAAAVLSPPVSDSVPHERVSLETGYEQMYNLDFGAAHQTFAAWERSHPDDPMGPVSDAAAFLFSEFEMLHILQAEFFTHDENFARTAKPAPNPDTRRAFESSLNKAHELASAALS